MVLGYRVWFGLAFIWFLLGSCKSPEKRSLEITPAVTDTMVQLSAPNLKTFSKGKLDSFFLDHMGIVRFGNAYCDFYEKRNWQFVWFQQGRLTETAFGLKANLFDLRDEDPLKKSALLKLDSLMQAAPLLSDTAMLQTELLLTGMYFYYAEKLLAGVDESISKKLGWMIPRKKLDMPVLLDRFLEEGGAEEPEGNLLTKQFALLQDALAFYRMIEDDKQEVRIPALASNRKFLKPGDTAQLLIPIHQRLRQLGYRPFLPDSNLYIKDLQVLVNNAKRAYGMTEDGKIDAALIDALNIPARERQKQLLVNLERLRWIPATYNYPHLIFVNIPDFRLHYFHKGEDVWGCKVVVGNPVHKTVIFSGLMEYVVFSPYWYVPQSIIRNEIGYNRARSSAYLRRKNMEWHQGSLREKPGPNNSLGLVKFIFPNSNSIYLHDTPAKDLFSRESRAFSHGCIRVSEPFELAKRVLANDTAWNDSTIYNAMHKGVEKKVYLKQKIPVYIGYFTAFIDQEGLLHFRKDIYERDEKLFDMLVKEKVARIP